MLILSRRVNEDVVIGTGPTKVRLCVVNVEGGKVKLGFSADRNVPIVRTELIEADEREGRDGV